MIVNPRGSRRVVVSRDLTGHRRLQPAAADCRVEIARSDDILAGGEPSFAAPPIVNADEPGLPRVATWPVTKEDPL